MRVTKWLPLLLCLALAGCAGTATGTGTAEGQVMIGPTCPVQRIDQPCPDKPFQATIDVVSSQGQPVRRFETDAEGRFRIALPPGNYTFKPVPNGIQRAPNVPVTVEEGKVTRVDIRYDSGIR